MARASSGTRWWTIWGAMQCAVAALAQGILGDEHAAFRFAMASLLMLGIASIHRRLDGWE